MTDWPTVRLEELAIAEKSAISKPYGSAILKEDYRLDGVPVVRGVNLARGIFHDDDFVFIAAELAARMPGAEMMPGDLVVTHRGTVGQVSMIPRNPSFQRYVASTSHVKVRLDPGKAFPEFYYYWFSSPSGKQSILENVSTVGVPGIAQPVATVKRLRVPHPPLPVQRAIAEVLGALDDKIAAEGRITNLVDQLIDTRFAQLAANAEDHVSVAETSDVIKGVSYRSADLAASDTAMVTLKSISREGRYSLRGLKSYTGPFKESQRFRSGDIAVAQTDLTQAADVVGWATRVPNSDEFKALVASLDIAIVRPRVTFRSEWVLGALREHAFRKYCQARTSGTTVLHLAKGAIESYRIPVLPESIMTEYSEFSRQVQARSDAGEQEIRVLAKTRDELLPLLMSGKLRVKDAEKKVEAIA